MLHISGLENQRIFCCTSARCVARSRCALVGAVLHICTGSADERSRRLRSLRRSPGPALDAECAAGFLERRACDPQLAPRRSLRKAHRKQGLPLSVCGLMMTGERSLGGGPFLALLRRGKILAAVPCGVSSVAHNLPGLWRRTCTRASSASPRRQLAHNVRRKLQLNSTCVWGVGGEVSCRAGMAVVISQASPTASHSASSAPTRLPFLCSRFHAPPRTVRHALANAGDGADSEQGGCPSAWRSDS